MTASRHRLLLTIVFALLFLGGCGVDLRSESGAAGGHLGDHGLDALENCGGRAVALFEGGDAGHFLGNGVDGSVAGFSERGEDFEGGGHFQFELAAVLF